MLDKEFLSKLSYDSLRRLRDDYDVMASVYRARMQNNLDIIVRIDRELNRRLSDLPKNESAPKCSDHIITGPAK